MNNDLSSEQRTALLDFASRNGRTWKSKLQSLWSNGRDASEKNGGLLRQVRNNLGPSWLTRFKP